MLVIGSHALAMYSGGGFRRPGDLDLICTEEEMLSFCLRYGLIAVAQASARHFVAEAPKYGHIDFTVTNGHDSDYEYLTYANREHFHVFPIYQDYAMLAPVEVLYSIKRSHRFRPRNWEKHIRDYHLLKSMAHFDRLPELTKQRTAEWKAHKSPSLQKTKDEFFKDDVSNHVFIHDEIHLVMAHEELPMYERIKVDADKVTCAKDKFFALDFDRQCKCVLEEAYVIALERGIIPMLFEGKKLADAESAMQWALMRICTTLTSGWFREFSVENYPAIWTMYDRQYVNKFLSAVESGRIKRIQEGS